MLSSFLLVVLSAYKQIRAQNAPVLSDVDEDNFDRAFAFFRPVIQGNADVADKKLTQDELDKTLDFCASAFEPSQQAEREAVLAKVESVSEKKETAEVGKAFNANLSKEEEKVLNHIQARKMMRTEDTMHISNFSTDVVAGFLPRLERGNFGLIAAQ